MTMGPITIIVCVLLVCLTACFIAYINHNQEIGYQLLKERVAKLEKEQEQQPDLCKVRNEYFHSGEVSNYTFNPNGTINVVLNNGTVINTMRDDIKELYKDMFGWDYIKEL